LIEIFRILADLSGLAQFDQKGGPVIGSGCAPAAPFPRARPPGFRSAAVASRMTSMLLPRLLSVMNRELQAQALQLSPYCTQQLEQLVGYGVQRMRVNKATEHAGHTLQAERNLKLLIGHFADYSRAAGGFPKLTNTEFDAALRCCPALWPYVSSP